MVVLALVLIGLLVPSGVLRFLRLEYRWLGRFVGQLEMESMRYGINFEHVLAFALLGAAARAALPSVSGRRLLLAVLVIASVTELAQFWIPGRTPRLADIVIDVTSACLGALPVLLLMRHWSDPKQHDGESR